MVYRVVSSRAAEAWQTQTWLGWGVNIYSFSKFSPSAYNIPGPSLDMGIQLNIIDTIAL